MIQHRGRLVLVGLIAAATVSVLGAGAVQAAADVPHGARSVATVASVRHAMPKAPQGWVLRGKYWTHSGCVEAGAQGVERHAWDAYQCANGTLQWVLWTDR